jgi:hypothetical protein
MYRNMSPDWTFAEDVALRTLVLDFIKRQGENVLRSRGTITLPNRLQFKLAAGEDRDLRKARDAWVKEKLQAAIDAGLVKPPTSEPAETKPKATSTGSEDSAPPRREGIDIR